MRILREENIPYKHINLDKKDKDILGVLSKNARYSTSSIARLLQTSRQSVEYRIKTMEDKHILAGAIALVNIKKLGYQSYHFFITLNDLEEEKKLVERCKKNHSCNALLHYSGKINYEISIMEKSPEEAKKQIYEILKGLSISNFHTTIIIKTTTSRVLPVKILENKNSKEIKDKMAFTKYFNSAPKEYTLDSKDKKILFELSQNAKIRLIDLSKKIGLTDDALSQRIKRLLMSRYIIEFRPVIDFSMLDLSLAAILIKTRRKSTEKNESLDQYLNLKEETLWAADMLGEWDHIVYVLLKSEKDLNKFITELKSKFTEEIESYEILIGQEEYKYSFMTENMKV